MKNEPLVSFLTPAYNGEKYIRQCIESVLNQSYGNWEYVIINNCSKDSTLEIAREYAAGDERIRVHDNEEFVGVIENHNIAVGQMSGESKYCKIVQADDFIYPTCTEEMVRVAEKYPSVGLVGSYRLCGDHVDQDGLPFPSEFVTGRDMCRLHFLDAIHTFGSPTATLIRAELIRKRRPFYREENIHADTEVCLEVLLESDFGFVHQVLSYTRLHEETVTSRTVQRLSTGYLGYFELLQKYGPDYLSEEEFRSEAGRARSALYRALSRCIRRREFDAIKRNAEGMAALGCRLSWVRLAATFGLTIAEELLPLLGRVTKPRRKHSAKCDWIRADGGEGATAAVEENGESRVVEVLR